MAILPNLPVPAPVEVVVSCDQDGTLDKISIEGGRHQEDFWPDSSIKYLAFSDGTLILYRETEKCKLLVLSEGRCFKTIESSSKKATKVIMTDSFNWVILGDRY